LFVLGDEVRSTYTYNCRDINSLTKEEISFPYSLNQTAMLFLIQGRENEDTSSFG